MAKRRGNKSEKIRQYLSENPKASAGEAAKALNVKPGLVYNVKSQMKAKSGRNGKRRGRRAAGVSGNGDAGQVIAAAKLIKACGGVDGAREALRAAEQVAVALEG